ncbi:MAG: hypothetical protein ACREVE_13000 [Gammaproteobacteria bacterium]
MSSLLTNPKAKSLALSMSGMVLVAAIAAPAAAAITITNDDTHNPTLMYRGAPMFKVGPIPEQAMFALEFGGADSFDHASWLDWMEDNRLAYGRVYPDSGYARLSSQRGHTVISPRAAGRLYPYEVVRWEGDKPIVDLTRFNPEYWDNMSRVIGAAKQRGVVLQMQLYQRVYFEEREDGWAINYFNPANNVNDYPVPASSGNGGLLSAVKDTVKDWFGDAEPVNDGYGLLAAMPEDTPWRDVHRQWVEHILNAIGDHGNVIIDLMNEGSFSKGTTAEWIETTLDIIEQWEHKTGNDIMVGMDFDHLYKWFERTGDREPLDYVLSNPRLDVIIAEGSESHVVPTLVAGDREPMHKDLALEFRTRYQKPVISTNSPAYGPHDSPEALHLYQWYSLLTKVQGVGVYAKEYPLDFSTPPVSSYARRSKILMRFFDQIDDYAALAPLPKEQLTAPGEFALALASPAEAVVYLHAGIGNEPIDQGAQLKLTDLQIPDGAVTIEALNPRSGQTTSWRGNIEDGTLTTRLRGAERDIAVRISPKRVADES